LIEGEIEVPASSIVLVPDTPAQASRTLSFAELGAAFRPGAQAQPDFFPGLPPPPILPGDERDDWRIEGTPVSKSKKKDFVIPGS
jgi:hypothetical protein